jgi:hypothetical protein
LHKYFGKRRKKLKKLKIPLDNENKSWYYIGTISFFGGGREMKIKKSNSWIVWSKVFCMIGIVAGLIFGVSVAWMKLLGYEPRIPTAFTTDGAVYSSVAVQRQHLLYVGACVIALILIAVIFRLIGVAVYKKRVKRALEDARKANTGYGGLLAGYNLDPETQEKVVDAAKKVVPLVAGLALTCVVVKAVKKSRAKRHMGEKGAASYYYYY